MAPTLPLPRACTDGICDDEPTPDDVEGCTDDPDYFYGGWTCAAWRGYECTPFTSDWTAADRDNLLRSCAEYAARHAHNTRTHIHMIRLRSAKSGTHLAPAQIVYRRHLRWWW